MSGGPNIDVPSGPQDPVVTGPGSVFASDAVASPTLPPSDNESSSAGFGRHAEATPSARPVEPGFSPLYYRTEQARARGVYRRANPWYRRLGRGVIAVLLLAAGATALYFGARELQDYLNRDRLPSAGVEVPAFRSTSFLITSSAPAPEVEGALTIDVQTRAFSFVGGTAGPQAGLEVISPDGSRVFARTNGGSWQEGNPAADSLTTLIPYLVKVDSADDLLANRMRNGYVSLVEKTSEGVGDGALDRYEMAIDTDEYSRDNPLLWVSFEQEVIPGVRVSPDLPVTIWLDSSNVVVRLRDSQSNWSWERLSYGDEPFDPDPTGALAATP